MVDHEDLSGSSSPERDTDSGRGGGRRGSSGGASAAGAANGARGADPSNSHRSNSGSSDRGAGARNGANGEGKSRGRPTQDKVGLGGAIYGGEGPRCHGEAMLTSTAVVECWRGIG